MRLNRLALTTSYALCFCLLFFALWFIYTNIYIFFSWPHALVLLSNPSFDMVHMYPYCKKKKWNAVICRAMRKHWKVFCFIASLSGFLVGLLGQRLRCARSQVERERRREAFVYSIFCSSSYFDSHVHLFLPSPLKKKMTRRNNFVIW